MQPKHNDYAAGEQSRQPRYCEKIGAITPGK
jgi:hypothetical protein